jgi:hypothetical protein
VIGSFPRGANGFARVDPRNPIAFAICDRCGQRFNRTDLSWQFDYRGAQLQNLRILVCNRKCYDEPQPQLRAYSPPPDPLPVSNPRPDMSDMGTLSVTGLGDDGGLVYALNPFEFPQSPFGLPGGAIYANGTFLSVVPGGVPFPGTPPMYYGYITAGELLQYGGASLSFVDPADGSGQLFINGGFIYIASASPHGGFINDNGVLQLTLPSGWPTSPVGLPAGAVWNNFLTVAVVPGVTPNPGASPVFFNVISSSGLLALGGGNLPLTNPGVPNQLWNNAGLVCIS